MIRAAILVLSGGAVTSVLLLARTLIVARLVSPGDFGIASTFVLAIAVVEMLSALGLQQQIVQAKQGDDPRFQAALQGFQAARGAMAGLALAALGWPLAAFLRIEEAAWGLQLLGLVPLLGGLTHFDIYRAQRSGRFAPVVVQSTVPALVSLAAIWPLHLWLGDWRIMLAAILLQAALSTVLSHLLAERRFRLAFARDVIADSTRFGGPILLSGALMFLAFNGDRLIVGRELGIEALGLVSMGFTLTLAPSLVLSKATTTLFLPRLSAAAHDGDPRQVRARSLAAHEFGLAMASLMILFTVAAVGPAVGPVLGAHYLPLVPLLPWFAVLSATRLAKAGAATIALAHRRNWVALWSNVPRAVALIPAWYALHRGADIATVLMIGAVAEALGAVLILALLDGVARQPWLALAPTVAAALLTAGVAVAWPPSLGGGASIAAVAAGVVLQLVLSRSLRTQVRDRRAAGRGGPPRAP